MTEEARGPSASSWETVICWVTWRMSLICFLQKKQTTFESDIELALWLESGLRVIYDLQQVICLPDLNQLVIPQVQSFLNYLVDVWFGCH